MIGTVYHLYTLYTPQTVYRMGLPDCILMVSGGCIPVDLYTYIPVYLCILAVSPRAHLVPSFILPELNIHLKMFKMKILK